MPKGAALQYHIKNLAAPGNDYNVGPVTSAGITGAGVILAVLDDGVDISHPAFAANFSAALSYDYVSGIANPSGNAVDGHGTGVAGIALGGTAWGGPIGVAPGATLEALRIDLDIKPVPGSPNVANPPDDTATTVAAMTQATKTADVANNSYGGSGVKTQAYTDGENNLINIAIGVAVKTGRGGRGLNLVYAAGNDGSTGDDVSFQAISSDPRVVAVGGVKPDGTPDLSLTHGAGLLVTGAGDDVVTASRFVANGTVDANGLPTNSYGASTGTSFAAPGVSGVIALMLQVNANLGWRDVQEILVDAAKVPGANAITKPDGTPWFTNLATGDWNGGGRHFSNAYGYGVPDADVAVQLAKTWQPYGTSANQMVTTVAGTRSATVVGGGPAVSTSLTYAVSMRIEHVQLTINAPTLTSANTRLILTAPDGTRSVVADQAGVAQDKATLPDGPSTAVTLKDKEGAVKTGPDGKPLYNTAPLTFTLNDAGFWGVDAKGAWTLQIVDFATGETGAVESWGLTFWGDAAGGPRTLVYTPEFAAAAAADPTRTMVRAGANTTIDAAALSGQTMLDLRGGAGMLGGVAVTVEAGIANATGGRGPTTLIGTAGANRLVAGDGDTVIIGGGGQDTLLGGSGQDVLVAGGGGAVVLSGMRGALVLLGDQDVLVGSGPDIIIGGTGTQTAFALNGGAEAFAGSGTLEFINGGASSTVVGGTGTVVAFGGDKGDVISGGTAGHNILVSGAGASTLFGGGDGDVLFAQGGAGQVIRAGSGNETLSGAGSSVGATYFAAAGRTVIGAGSGNDTIFGGSGSATVNGGAGADLYAFKAGEDGGSMLIGGFNPIKGDRITLQGFGTDAVDQALSTATFTPGGYTIVLPDKTRVSFSDFSALTRTAFV